MFPSSTSTNDSGIISSSSSASSSSSSSPFSHNNNNISNNNISKNTKTMEEVWKDITITSLPNTPLPHNNHYINNTNNNHIIHHPTPSSNFRGMILQDFLNCPAIYQQQQTQQQQQQTQQQSQQQQHFPTTALKLNSHEFQMFEKQDYQMHSAQNNFVALGGFDDLATNSMFGSSEGLGKKRSCDETSLPENTSVDRRHKRMIKNRESAARSRARKQAYITELELEVAHLAEENSRLRKQQQQMFEAPPTQLPKKHGLHRTTTAPF